MFKEKYRDSNRGIIINTETGTLIFTNHFNWKLRILKNEKIKCQHNEEDYISLEKNHVNFYGDNKIIDSIPVNKFRAYALLG